MRPDADGSDVAIIGAGPAGAHLARALAASGRAVTVFELGPARDLSQLVSSQIWARRLKWGGPPVLHPPGADRFSFALSAGSGLGGAGLHHYATWPRLHEADFALRTRYGRAVDWPFGYGALRPWYDRVQSRVGLAGDAAAEVWRPPGEPYPLPPLATGPQGRAIARGFSALGLRTAPLPAAILTEPRGDRAACLYDGWCDAGCPIGALWNPLVQEIPRARDAGAVFRTGSPVVRIEAEGDRATGVLVAEGGGGARRFHAARIVIVATGAIQSARLLLASAGARHPDGLGNARGLVGTGFMAHGLALVFGLFPERTEPAAGVSCGQLISHDHYAKDRVRGAFGSVQWQIAPAAKPNDIFGIAITRPELFGARLTEFLRRAAHHFGSMAGLTEDVPRPSSRIVLAAETDAYGMRLARVERAPDPDGVALHARALEDGRRIFAAAGATDIWTGPNAAGHILGGTPMGNDPATSVCDAVGRVHDLRNVFVAGSSLFPTGGAVNPTFTVTALAARTAAELTEHWSRYAA